MPHLSIATVASDGVLGAGVYQREIRRRAPATMSYRGAWRVDDVVVRSLRSGLTGNRRVPLRAVATASARLRRQVGRVLYPRDAVVHRMQLELPPAPGRDVVTLHDVVAWRYPDESAPVPAAAEEIRRAAAVVCVSAYSAGEAVEALGIDPPHVVHNGVDDAFYGARPAGPETLTRLEIERPFVITTGGASERKNLAGLADAWPRVHRARPSLTLVLTGPEHPRRTSLFAGMPGVRMTGLVDTALMPGLLAASEAVVVPSRYEGFGFPALEGMAVGVPVVAARRSSLPEVVEDGGHLVEPDGRGLADGILDVLAGGPAVERMVHRGRARAAELTWERCLEGHARVWEAVARS